MNPVLAKGKFVICTVSDAKREKLCNRPLLIFREREGITVIIEKGIADAENLSYKNIWSMITLNVHSDLNAVGFLAAITKKLAQHEISVNAVSAYYHDHLFVPNEKANQAMKLLKELSE